MAAWLWASAQADTGDASIADYAAILFGVSNVLGAMILFFERVSHHPPLPSSIDPKTSQCFFTHRILKVSNNHLLTFIFFIFCIFSFTAALGAASLFFTNATADLTSQLSGGWIFPLVILSGLACDLAISIVTAFYLRYQTPIEIAECVFSFWSAYVNELCAQCLWMHRPSVPLGSWSVSPYRPLTKTHSPCRRNGFCYEVWCTFLSTCRF